MYTLCPVMPRKGVILSNERFQQILSELKLMGESAFREKLMMAKRALKNSEQCVLEFDEFMPKSVTQGPHKVQDGISGKVVRIKELNLCADIIEKAYFRVIELPDAQVIDIIVNLEHQPIPVFVSD